MFEKYSKQYINGEWRDGSSENTYNDVNPFDNSVLATFKLANRDDIDAAYKAASAAQKVWANTPSGERKQILLKAADLFAERRRALVPLLVAETGSTVAKAVGEIFSVVEIIREAANYCDRMDAPTVLPSNMPGKESLVYHQPAGVVGIISPFNYPLNLSIRAVAPALAVGDTVVIKPDLQTQISGGFLIAEIFEEAGLPKGVLNVLSFSLDEVGDYFVEHPIPNIISFTGSTAVGRRIGALCGQNLKRVALELGGNSPLVVLEDADIEKALNAAIFGKFFHQGQICMITNRILVHRKHYDEFVSRFVERASALVCGDPSDSQVNIGPIINETQINKIMRIIEEAKSDGNKLVLEGERIGNVITPFVFADVANNSKLAQTEIFGPVAVLIPFDTEEEALAMANETQYGLAASVFTEDLDRGVEFACRVESGMVHVNDQTINSMANAPFGGVKGSGLGRYGGDWAFEEFTTVKWVSVQKEPRKFPF